MSTPHADLPHASAFDGAERITVYDPKRTALDRSAYMTLAEVVSYIESGDLEFASGKGIGEFGVSAPANQPTMTGWNYQLTPATGDLQTNLMIMQMKDELVAIRALLHARGTVAATVSTFDPAVTWTAANVYEWRMTQDYCLDANGAECGIGTEVATINSVANSKTWTRGGSGLGPIYKGGYIQSDGVNDYMDANFTPNNTFTLCCLCQFLTIQAAGGEKGLFGTFAAAGPYTGFYISPIQSGNYWFAYDTNAQINGGSGRQRLQYGWYLMTITSDGTTIKVRAGQDGAASSEIASITGTTTHAAVLTMFRSRFSGGYLSANVRRILHIDAAAATGTDLTNLEAWMWK